MTKVTLYLDETVWRLFRIECLQRGTSASKEIERWLRDELHLPSRQEEEQTHA